MRLPFCIFKLQDDRSQHFVEAVQALNNAKVRVQALAELRFRRATRADHVQVESTSKAAAPRVRFSDESRDKTSV